MVEAGAGCGEDVALAFGFGGGVDAPAAMVSHGCGEAAGEGAGREPAADEGGVWVGRHGVGWPCLTRSVTPDLIRGPLCGEGGGWRLRPLPCGPVDRGAGNPSK